MTAPIVKQVPDASGQIVDATQEGLRLNANAVVQPSVGGVQALKFIFDEDMSTAGGDHRSGSVTNPANWSLSYNGTLLSGAVSQVAVSMESALAQV